MSIASRITSMENNIRNAYHGLESIGIDDTGVNKNIENISALLDDFYGTLPKVSGSGTNINLTPTKKGRITSQIKGYTLQNGTPTPTTPVAIQSVTGLQNISVKGSNIFDNSVGGTAGQYLNDSGNVSTGYITLNYSDYIAIPENETKLYVSGMDNDLMNAPAICFYDSNKTFISGERYNSRATATINIPTNAKYFRTSYRTNYTNFMIQTLDIYDINLGTIELNKIGDYQDYISGTPNNWVINNQVGKVVLNGTENWGGAQTSTGNVNYTYIYTGNFNNYAKLSYSNCYCNKMDVLIGKMVRSTEVNVDTVNISDNDTTSRLRIMILTSRLTAQTTDAFKTWLSNNNIEVRCVLETPTTEPITNQELITQLNNWYYAMSKTGETNISVDGSLPIILDVSALKGEE